MTEESSRQQLEKVCLPLIALLPFDIVPVVAGRSIVTPFLLLAAWAWLLHVGRFGTGRILGRNVVVLLYLWLTWCTATILWTVAPKASTLAVVSLLAQLLMVAILVEALPGLGDRAIVWFTAGATLLAVWALTTPVEEDLSGRVRVGGVDQNVTALVLALGLAGLAYLLMFSGRRISLLGLLQVTVTVAAVVKVGSRTGIVAAVAIVAVPLVISAVRLLRARPNAILRGALILFVGFLTYRFLEARGMIPPRVLLFLASPFDTGDSDRGVIIDMYWQFREIWWLHGVGYGADSGFLGQQGVGYQNAHSLSWKTWIETGIVGLGILGSILIIALYRAWRTSVSAAALMSVPLAAFAITLGGDRASVFWFVVALALSTRKRTAEASEVGGGKHDAGPHRSRNHGPLGAIKPESIRGSERDRQHSSNPSGG